MGVEDWFNIASRDGRRVSMTVRIVWSGKRGSQVSSHSVFGENKPPGPEVVGEKGLDAEWWEEREVVDP